MFGEGLETDGAEGICMTSWEMRMKPCEVGRGLFCPGDYLVCTGPFSRRAHYFKKLTCERSEKYGEETKMRSMNFNE